MPKSVVWQVLKSNNLYPYKFERAQELLPADPRARRTFCRWVLRKHRADPEFVKRILFTDESTFPRTWRHNAQNMRHWGNENPHNKVISSIQRRFSLNLWAGIVGNQFIGPTILPNRLRGASYLNFLQEELPELLEDVPLETRGSIWFMQDGAPPHTTLAVQNYLNEEFQGRVISTGRLIRINYPPRSPDLNPLDFYYWGTLKGKVYNTPRPFRNLHRLGENVFAAAEEIAIDVQNNLETMRANFIQRLERCLENNGGYVE